MPQQLNNVRSTAYVGGLLAHQGMLASFFLLFFCPLHLEKTKIENMKAYG
jgi:hypothetical protein